VIELGEPLYSNAREAIALAVVVMAQMSTGNVAGAAVVVVAVLEVAHTSTAGVVEVADHDNAGPPENVHLETDVEVEAY